MAIDVFYVRHGEIAAKVPGDTGLSPAGVAMARQAGSALAHRGATSVVSSPLARAAETAREVAAACGLTAEIDPRLRERLNWGDVADQPFDEFVELWDRCSADRRLVPPAPAGRSACQAGCGAIELVDELVDEVVAAAGRAGPVVLVAHGGLLVDMFRCLADAGRGTSVDQGIDVPYCSITRMRWDEHVELVELAVTSHLSEVRTTRAE